MKTRLLLLCTVLCLPLVPAMADEASDIHQRIEQRLPAIDKMKAVEAIGENNRGFVEARGNAAAGAAQLVADENRDREAVYALIAQKTGATPDSVGRLRAKQIAANSRPGVWVQDESGEWKKK